MSIIFVIAMCPVV